MTKRMWDLAMEFANLDPKEQDKIHKKFKAIYQARMKAKKAQSK